jgi:uncharacterized protein with HEPN domain
LKQNERDPILYLEDMLLSMQRVAEYVSGLDFKSFKQDYKTVDAVVRNFEIIGEASKNLAQSFKNNNPEIPWEEMYRLRNRVTHEYFGIDYEIIWDIATKHLPKNLTDVELILNREKLKGK